MFAPLLPSSGVIGYQLLTSTEESQRAVFEAQPEVAREVDYFVRNIGAVETAEDLVSDRRLLAVALGAFGLDEEIDKRAFMQRILAEGTEDPDAFANVFVDPRYNKITDAFGFADIGGPQTSVSGFAQTITSAYTEKRFEIAVGEQDESLRLALNFRREIATYATASDPDGTAWLSVLGDQPVRQVFEDAFGLSSASFAQIDVDRQQSELRRLNDRAFGSTSLDIFQDEAVVDTAIKRFLAQRSVEEGPSASTRGFAALTLLSAAANGFGDTGVQNLVISSTL
ncbi:MAG: DUF1217 domain-containing protein [Pseudomonadota bacterium]